jgi:hypothetical protein
MVRNGELVAYPPRYRRERKLLSVADAWALRAADDAQVYVTDH